MGEQGTTSLIGVVTGVVIGVVMGLSGMGMLLPS
jgi:hypothetical protein